MTSEQFTDAELESIFANSEDTNVDGDDQTTNDGVVVTGVQHDSQISATFDGVNPGDYEFNFSVADASVSDSASVTVTKPGDKTAGLADDSVTVESGDSDSINVTLENTKNGVVHIGSNSTGYNVTAEVTDTDGDGKVNISVNTFNVSEENDFGLSSDEGLTVNHSVSHYQGDGRLDPGTYEVEVASATSYEQGQVNEVGTLSVLERSTDAASSWTTYDSALNTDYQDVVAAIENGQVSQRDTVAKDDLAVIQIQASGVYGYLESVEQNGDNGLAAIYGANDGQPVSLNVTHQNPGTNKQPVQVSADALSLHTSDDKNSMFLVVDMGADEDISAGQTFEVNDLNKDNPVELNTGDEDQRVSTTFSVTERTAEFDVNDDDLVEVTPSEDATISGETTIAPGSDVTLRIRSEEGASTPFIMSETVNVSNDGTFSAQFDFSEQDVGTNFTVTASVTPSFDGDVSAKGTVVTADSDVGDGNETETPDDTTSTPDDTTETTTPGFGAIVALVALVGAALLAVRRE